MSEFETILSKAERELSFIVGTRVSLSVSLSPQVADKMIYMFTGGHEYTEFEKLVTLVRNHFNLTEELLFGLSKETNASQARQIIYFLAHETLHMHVSDIAKKCKRERSTVIRMIERTKVQMHHSNALSENLQNITKHFLTSM